MKLTLDRSSVRTLLRDRNGPVQSHARNLTVRTQARARQLARQGKTGELRRSISIDSLSGPEGGYSLSADTPYAMAEHEGAKPHIIRARRTAALHFMWHRVGLETVVPREGGFRTHVTRGGILVIGKGYVSHPGTQGTKFLTRAMEEVVGRG